jgi:hypothetical protein
MAHLTIRMKSTSSKSSLPLRELAIRVIVRGEIHVTDFGGFVGVWWLG